MKIPENIIRRKSYLEKIESFIDTPLIKVITGQRRVGKSYLLFLLIEEIQKRNKQANIIYINCEDIEFSHIQSYLDLHQFVSEKIEVNTQNYLFIDEIQDIPEFEKALRSLLLNESLDIFITGSNAHLLSGELATLLAGRYMEFPVYSLSYLEFLNFHNLKDNDESLEKYSLFGGLPYLVHVELTENTVFEYLKNVYNSIVFRDVVSRYSVRNTNFLEKLIRFLSENIGSQFAAKNISDYLRSQKVNISVNLVLNYVDYLVNAFIIHRVNRYDIVGKRVFEIGEKYYFENTGIRNVILGGYSLKDRGKMLENLIYNHLKFRGYNIKVGAVNQLEIDFVCEKEGRRIYVQSALTINQESTMQREFGNLQKISDNYPKMVVTMDAFSGSNYEGIEHYSIRDFLQKDI